MSAELQSRLESMTLGQWQAHLIEKSAKILAVFVESMPADKLKWQPAIDQTSKTRSVLEQIGECIYANNRFRSFFQGETPPAVPTEWDTFESGEDAVAQLKSSAAKLAEIVRGMDSAALAKDYITHRGPMPGALAMQLPVRNMTYHMGQINMIQLLYGDSEFHIDSEFTTL